MRLIILFLLISSCFAQPPTIQWQKCFGGSGDEEAYAITLIDSDIVVTGYTNSFDGDITNIHNPGSSSYDVWFLKIDNSIGTLITQKCFGGNLYERGNSILENFENGFIIAGYTDSDDGDIIGLHGFDRDFWILKIDSTLDIQWQKCIGGTGLDVAYGVIVTSDSGYFVTGYTESNDGDISGFHGSDDVFCSKLDASGNLQWTKTIGGALYEEGKSAIQTSDGGYLISGSTNSFDWDVTNPHDSTEEVWVEKLDSAGHLLWQKCYGGTGGEFSNTVMDAGNNCFYVSASTNSNDYDVTGFHGNSDFWLFKADSAGTLIWNKCYGGSGVESSRAACRTSDGGIVMVGFSSYDDGIVVGNHGFYDYWVLKIDSAGNYEWAKCLGGTNEDYAYAVKETIDGGIVVAGSVLSNDGDVTGYHGGEDAWVVKLAPLGLQTPEYKNNLQDLTIFQTNDQINLRFFSKTNRDAQFSIYNLEGQQIFSEETFITEGINHHSINCSSFTNGIYFLKIDGKDFSMGVKVVVGDR